MSLPTLSKLSIASPLVNTAQPTEEQIRRGRGGVGMAAITNWYHLHVRGLDVESMLVDVYVISPMPIGAVLMVSDGILVRLRRDEFVLLTADPNAAQERLGSKAARSLVSLTDITHGRAMIGLCGPHARAVLPKLCGLDFADSKFPDRHAAQTSLAKVRTLILRMDVDSLPVYYLVVDRSLANYVWEVLYDAAQEWDGIVLSRVEQLRK